MIHTSSLKHTPTHTDECLPFNKGFLIIFHWFQGSVNLNQRSANSLETAKEEREEERENESSLN